MFVPEERRKELLEKYGEEYPEIKDLPLVIEDTYSDDGIDALEEWELYHFIELGERAWDKMIEENGSITKEELKNIQKEFEETYANASVEDIKEDWIAYKGDQLKQESDARFLAQYKKDHDIPEVDNAGFDDSAIQNRLDESYKSLTAIEKHLKEFQGKPETIKAYKESIERHKDEPEIVEFLERCISNGGGNPSTLEENIEYIFYNK